MKDKKLKQVILVYSIRDKKLLSVQKKEFGNDRVLEDQYGEIYIKNNNDSNYRKLEKRVVDNLDDFITIKEYYVTDRAKFVAYNILEDYIERKLGYNVKFLDYIKVLKL